MSKADVMLHSEVSVEFGEFQRFALESPHETLALGTNYKFEISPLGFIELIKNKLGAIDETLQVRIDSFWGGQFTVKVSDGFGTEVAVGAIDVQPNEAKLTVQKTLHFNLRLVGWKDFVLEAEKALDTIESDALAQVTWVYSSRGYPQHAEVILPKPHECKPEFYPFLPEEPFAFFDKYLKSEASVMILMGPPGTGKTSLMKNMLNRHKLNAMITYDEELMKSDELYVQFMLGDRHSLFVIEDADLMLAAREDGENRVMSKFLNVSDGLIKFPNKKLIFTTNLEDTRKIDPALMRPGRCFAVVHFRKLFEKEARVAARAAGVDDPGCEVSLAELFNGFAEGAAPRKVGFAV